MTYGFVLDVPAPIEVYDALHAEIIRRKDPTSCGMLLHVGRPTPEGFRGIEIWKSKEQQELSSAEVAEGEMTQFLYGYPPTANHLQEEYEPRGLIVRGAQ